jgi:hypothetical protein
MISSHDKDLYSILSDMGQELSNSFFQEQVHKVAVVEHLLRKIFKDYKLTLNIFTGTISYSPSDVIRDVVEGSSYLLVCNSFTGEGRIRKLLAYGQFNFLRQIVCDINSLLNGRAESDNEIADGKDCDSDECMICMEKSVEIVLPCSHSFCTNCFEVSSLPQIYVIVVMIYA